MFAGTHEQVQYNWSPTKVLLNLIWIKKGLSFSCVLVPKYCPCSCPWLPHVLPLLSHRRHAPFPWKLATEDCSVYLREMQPGADPERGTTVHLCTSFSSSSAPAISRTRGPEHPGSKLPSPFSWDRQAASSAWQVSGRPTWPRKGLDNLASEESCL